MIDIRAARPSDATALARLRYEFRAALASPTELRDAFVARCAEWMSTELGGGGAWRAWVAVDDERIVGQVWVHLIEKVPNPVGERHRHAYLSSLYVTPAARGGTGTRLLQTALDWAAAQEVDRVVLWPSARSRSLYLRHAFVSAGEVLELTLR
jgi:GNAT superfamily N-acetyltransferase